MEINLSGHSGCVFTLSGNILTKHANYKDVANDLEACTIKQRSLSRANYLHPLKVLNVLSARRLGETYKIEMLYIPEKDLHETDGLSETAKSDLNRYFSNLSINRNDFHFVIRQRLFTIRETPLKEILSKELTKVKNEYPFSSCHGDFGFKNMIECQNTIYTFDVRNTFIQSRLHDIATLWINMYDCEDKEKKAFFKELWGKFSPWHDQINIIRKLRVLELYNPEHNDENVNKMHETWFNAR